ncbi:MAG: stalk domain-containing protein [Caldisericia bacterium]|nr:stalk domain-containing protein [Caldisericia bacterium]
MKICRILVSLFVVISLVAPFNTNVTSADTGREPSFICANQSHVFVWNNLSQKVHVFDHTHNEIRSFPIVPPMQSFPAKPVAFNCDEKFLYILDQQTNSIVVFAFDGTFQKTVPNLSPLLVHPTSFTIHNDILYIADQTMILGCTQEGILVEKFTVPTYEKNALITHISYNSVLTCVVNASRVYTWNTFSSKWDSPIGSFGKELGNFTSIQCMDEYGSIVVFDSYKQALYRYNANLATWIPVDTFSQQHCSDFCLYGENVYSVGTQDTAYQILPLYDKTPQKYTLSMNEIQFVLSTSTHFTMWSNTSYPLAGTVASDHPGIIVKPSTFLAAQQSIEVQIDPSQFDDPSAISQSLTLTIEGHPSQTIPVKAQFQSPKHTLVFTPTNNATISLSRPVLRLSLQTTKEFEDTLEIKFLPSAGKTSLQPQDIQIEIPTKKNSQFCDISLQIPMDTKPGFYPMVMQVTSNAYKFRKQFTFQLLYQNESGTLKKTQIGELFTAPWCAVCPSAERSIPELLETYSTNDINFVNYFLDCVTVEELCTPQADTKKHSYGVSGTPTMVFNGTTKEVGGVKSQTATMTHKYLPIIQAMEHNPSFFSLSGWATLESSSHGEEPAESSRQIQLYSRIQMSSHECNWNDFKLYQVLVENQVTVLKKERNEEGEIIDVEVNHDNVFRKYNEILPDPSHFSTKNSPLWDDVSQMQVPDYVDLSHCYLIYYLQNKDTHEIVQSRTVEIQTSPPSSTQKPNLYSQQKQLFGNTKDTISASVLLQNPNDHPVKYRIQCDLRNATAKDDFQISSDAFIENGSILVLPYQFVPITLQGTLATLEDNATVSVTILDIDPSSSIQIPIIKEWEPGWFKKIYPKDPQTISFGRPWFVLQTQPGTKLLKRKTKEVLATSDKNGILLFQPKLEVGMNELAYDLLYPDQTMQAVEYNYFQLREIKLQLSSEKILLDRNPSVLEYPLYLFNNRTMLYLIDTMIVLGGCEVQYDAAVEGITLISQNSQISFIIDQKIATVDGEEYSLDAPASRYLQRIYVPLRFVFEHFGFQVLWDATDQNIAITNQP